MKPPARVKVVVTGVGAYDPEGDRSENGGDAHLATDGIPTTAWKTEHYRTTFHKSGVGLVVDAGKPVKATRVVVTTDTPGYAARVQVGNSATGPFTDVSGSKTTTAPHGLRTEAAARALPGALDHLDAGRRRCVRERDRRHGRSLTMSLAGAIAAAVGPLIGLPGLIPARSSRWTVWLDRRRGGAAACRARGFILWLGWFRRRDDDGPAHGPGTMWP